MTEVASPGWLLTSFTCHVAGAIICLIAAGWLLRRADKERPDRVASLIALVITSAWAAMVAAFGPLDIAVVPVEIMRNLAWIFLLYRLFATDGRDESMTVVRPVIWALCFVELLQLVLLVIQLRFAITPELQELTYQVSAMFRVIVSVGALLLLHNLYSGASAAIRPVLRWSATALAVLWVYALNYQTISYLSGSLPIELSAFRGLIVALVAVFIVLSMNRTFAEMRLSPSRAVTFQTISLLVIGGYLLLMVVIAQAISMFGGNFGRLTQVGFVVVASVAALLWLPSQRLRGWLRVTTVKHLFQHRYDYRAEWLRFTGTIGHGGDNSNSLHERVIKALADITDSPSGLLLLPGENGALELASRWQWRDIEVPAEAISADLVVRFESEGFILDLDDVRSGNDRFGEAALLPDWLCETDQAWALVPLLHFDRLTGVVVLSRPGAPRSLDWEDFDLLRVVGQQLASYLAEQTGHHALMESARFDEFSRRMAFVMHDIKNLASQLSLLARNAERHAEKPEFRADMLVTLRNSADKLNGLLDRLGRYGAQGSAQLEEVDLVALTRSIAARYDGAHPVSMTRSESGPVLADAEALEQALVHLVQNAVEASESDMPVHIDVSSNGMQGRIDIIDSGCGMSPDFVRNGLFKPFVSSKNSGFGIGAFEARELIRAMGGRVEVESREELGTRFVIHLPLAAAASFLEKANNTADETAGTEVA